MFARMMVLVVFVSVMVIGIKGGGTDESNIIPNQYIANRDIHYRYPMCLCSKWRKYGQ